MAQVRLSQMPSPSKEYVVNFQRLDGGLNTWELDYRLDANESPEMKNLWWKNGALCCRDGQVYASDKELGTAYSCYEDVYNGDVYFHIGGSLYVAETEGPDKMVLCPGVGASVPRNRGTWFRYGDKLYYKNRGGYFAVSKNKTVTEMPDVGAAVTMISCNVEPVTAYTPIILINTEPTTAAGDEYQGENRLSGQKIVWYSTVEGVKEYKLPVQNIDSVDKVVVDEEELSEGIGYTVDLAKGTVTFKTEPTHHEPVQVNTVRITFTKANPDAYNSIMDCNCAAVYGGDQNVCVVFGGCTAQPNAYFWCGNHAVMDPGYFPFEQYNLAGDAGDAITGFGKQQNMLVIFKERSIGRAEMGSAEMASGRILLTMDYTAINAGIGCDLPHSIQLVENNLVFANTKNGVCIVRDSSAAYENNITPISRKVDNGLLPLLGRGKTVCSHDDGERYWLVSDGEVYCWDYTLSGYTNPVWFYFTNIHAVDFLNVNGATLHLDNRGRVTVMTEVLADYGEAIEKKYRFAAQNMGGYDRLKDITGVIFTVRGESDSEIRVVYETDHERREDLTPVRALSWHLAPQNLAYRNLSVLRFAEVARRKPGCRHVRHFTMALENNKVGMDLAVISAQVLYRYRGRDR